MDSQPGTALEWSETLNRFQWDQWLREGGFRVVSRPRVGPVVWLHVRSGVKFTEMEAMGLLAKQKRGG